MFLGKRKLAEKESMEKNLNPNIINFGNWRIFGQLAGNGCGLAFVRNRSQQALTNYKYSWENALSKPTSQHEAKLLLSAAN